MLNTELRKIRHGGRLFIFIAAVCLLMFYGDTREASERYGLQTGGQMIDFYGTINAPIAIAINHIANKWDLNAEELRGRITSYYELSFEIEAPQFKHLGKPALGFFAMAMFLAPYYIGMDFKARVFNNALYAGRTRASVFTARVGVYFALCAVMSVVVSFALVLAYSASMLGKLPAIELLSYFAKRLLTDLAIMSIPLALVCAFRTVVYPALITFGVCAIAWFGFYTAGSAIPLWLPCVVLPLCIVASWLSFRRADLA
ncbi:MAG: hypothetical protein LBM98_12290 [Oscillospiraceae bacterium]|jgi:hypothetical protein|nr:hypothetical protein [Oscillospiraceae bacterium]